MCIRVTSTPPRSVTSVVILIIRFPVIQGRRRKKTFSLCDNLGNGLFCQKASQHYKCKEHNMFCKNHSGEDPENKNGGIRWKWGNNNNNKAGCTLARDQTVLRECLLITFPWNAARALKCGGRKTDCLSAFNHIIDTVAYVLWLWFMSSIHIVSLLCTSSSLPGQWHWGPRVHKSMNRCWPKHLTSSSNNWFFFFFF